MPGGIPAPRHHTAYGVNCTPCVPPLRGCKGPRSYTVPRKSQIAPRKSGDSAQRWRVSRNGAPQAGEKKGRWAAGWGVPLPEPFPSPPISPCSLRRPPPFRCERSEQRNPLHSRQDLAAANAVSGGIPCILGRTSAVDNAVEPPQCGGSTGHPTFSQTFSPPRPSRCGRRPHRGPG